MPESVPENSSDYKSHVLYVVPEETNSQKALQLLSQHQAVQEDVWVQDVRILQPPLPEWLNGVPTIISRKHGEPYRGTACLQYLQHLQQSTPNGMQALPPGMSKFQSFSDGTPVQDLYEEISIEQTSKWLDDDVKVDGKMVDQYMAERDRQNSALGHATEAKELVSTQS